MTKDVRWVHRFNHFKKAYTQLNEALTILNKRELSNLEKQGTI